MNKIYNNLTIENLMKSNWLSLFNKGQQEEIKLGIENNVDIFIYAKKEFDRDQMREIRFGLVERVDVSVYAKSCFDAEQMWFIRRGINEGIDVSIYAKPSIPWQEMKEIKEQLIEEKENEKRTQKLKSRKLNKNRSLQ